MTAGERQLLEGYINDYLRGTVRDYTPLQEAVRANKPIDEEYQAAIAHAQQQTQWMIKGSIGLSEPSLVPAGGVSHYPYALNADAQKAYTKQHPEEISSVCDSYLFCGPQRYPSFNEKRYTEALNKLNNDQQAHAMASLGEGALLMGGGAAGSVMRGILAAKGAMELGDAAQNVFQGEYKEGIINALSGALDVTGAKSPGIVKGSMPLRGSENAISPHLGKAGADTEVLTSSGLFTNVDKEAATANGSIAEKVAEESTLKNDYVPYVSKEDKVSSEILRYPNKISFRVDLPTHINKPEGISKNGVSGGHNRDEFLRFSNKNNIGIVGEEKLGDGISVIT